MKKNLKTLIPLFLTCFIIFGCASDKGGKKFTTGPAASDIVEYINQDLIRIAELEKKSLERYASVIGDNYTTDQRVYDELKDFVIPTYGRFLEELRNIAPENPEIKSLHAIYIRGAESIYDGFRTKMIGIENNDENIIIQGNEKIEKGRDEIEKWRLERYELYKKHGVAEITE